MSVARVDAINLGLLIIAFVAAYVLPFEVLLASYAFLGPAHYLTEISWLHDRKYFTIKRLDPWLLLGASLFLLYLGASVVPESSELVWLLLLLAFCTAFVKTWFHRAVILGAGFLLMAPLLGSSMSFLGALLIPTVVHVYLFTLLFMLFGSLKSGSRLGYLNTGLFFFLAIILVLLPHQNWQWLSVFVGENAHFFAFTTDVLAKLFSLSTTEFIVPITSFLAFTYTYHYLNWFSKTSIIEWHDISLNRLAIIVALYAAFVGVYLYDYAIGFYFLLTLSFLHVVLEFPLNFKSMQGIYTSLFGQGK